MKKLSIITKMIMMFMLCVAVISVSGALSAEAEEYEPVSIDSLSERHLFYAGLNGYQYEDTLYFNEDSEEDWYSDDIWFYTNDMAAAGQEPEIFIAGIGEVFYYDQYLIYTDASYNIHLYDTVTKKDKIIVKGKAYFISDFKDGVIKYRADRKYKYVNLKGKKAQWPKDEENAPSFEQTSEMNKVSLFNAKGDWYAGVKLTNKKYQLYRYDGEKYVTVIASTKVPTTECYVVNDMLCFIRKKVKGQAVIYHLKNDKLVKAGSYDSCSLFGDDAYAVYTQGGYLVIKSMGDCYDSCYAFDENFKELYQYCYSVENQPYIFEIKDGILFEDYYDEWDEERDPDFRYNMINLDELRKK